MNDEIAYLSATEVRERFKDRVLTPSQYLEILLERISVMNPLLNAFTELYVDEAREQARAADSLYEEQKRNLRPLEGIPVAIKDETPVAGKRTTEGSLLNAEHVDEEDAALVTRIKEAGGIILGRTATPEFCVAPFTHSKVWGITRNPWNIAYSPGGSSGGAGAALAAGLIPLADGSDIGGSIRIPAAFTGTVGFKPPYGRVPGVAPYNLDHYCHQGPMARTVQDCALLQNIISGQHDSDPVTIPEDITVEAKPSDSLEGLTVAVSLNLGGFNVDEKVLEVFQKGISRLQELGAEIVHVQVPWTFEEVQFAARAHFSGIFGAEMKQLAKESPDVLTDYVKKFAEILPSEDGVYFQGLELESKIHEGLNQIFKHADALVCPTMAIEGFEAGNGYVDEYVFSNGEPIKYFMDACLTLPFNIASRNPVITVPVGRTAKSMPVGMQIVGPPFKDQVAFTIASTFEAQSPWYSNLHNRPEIKI